MDAPLTAAISLLDQARSRRWCSFPCLRRGTDGMWLAPAFHQGPRLFMAPARARAASTLGRHKALRDELGEESANKLVATALRGWSREMFVRIGALVPGSPKEKWTALTAAAMPRIGSDVDFEMLKRETEALEFIVTGCRCADFFRALGEPELGAILLCEADDHMAEVGSPEVEMTRMQTIMQGATYCDFRYRLKTGGAG